MRLERFSIAFVVLTILFLWCDRGFGRGSAGNLTGVNGDNTKAAIKYAVNGEVTITGNPVCGGAPCTETLRYAFVADFFPLADYDPLIYWLGVETDSGSVTSFGALGSSFEFTGYLGTPMQCGGGDTNYLELVNSAGDEIDLHECPNLVNVPAAPYLHWTDLYRCSTTTCVSDFVPPNYGDSPNPPVAGIFLTGSGSQTATQLIGQAPSSGLACDGAYDGIFYGDLTISVGQNCIFLGGGITGNVTQNGGNLILTRATIGGNLHINGGTFSVGPSTLHINTPTTINGNIEIKNMPPSTAQNQVCGVRVNGNLQFHNNDTAVQIGSTFQSCAGNLIGGNLDIHNNTAQVLAFNNIVSGNVQCQNNNSIQSGGNSAKHKQGQCGR